MRCARIGSRRRRILAAGFVVAGWMVLLMPGQAWAQFYVRSPEVEKGELEVEEHGAFYSGPGEDERLDNTHEVEEKYGLTCIAGRRANEVFGNTQVHAPSLLVGLGM